MGRKALDGVDPHVEHPLELLLLVLGIEGMRNISVNCKTETVISVTFTLEIIADTEVY